MINVGKILRSQGDKGELRLRLYQEEAVKLLHLTKIHLGKEGFLKEFQVEDLTPKGKAVNIKLVGVDSLAQADQLAGLEVFVSEEMLRTPEEDKYYYFQLEGCSVRLKGGEEVGIVADVLSHGESNLLVVKRGDREILIPFHKTICLDVDPVKKEILIDAPEGLLDLNEI